VNSYPAHRGARTSSAATSHAPNAALLIDFDNVTLGVRSDLTKELRHLLDSDIIKGKVSVQRAYADWRRYPQYIVPLSESSIDLIFAPAFGTNKKNATDIRLAIDATELVFTRPEIGTFILLSGDSDFSSLVIKLKEYGKYVIGVGIRESASDILIQNCDEYYSYTELAGLTKEADLPSTQRDPWELVGEAVRQMAANRDVMRADRLKQVMQQIDPNFDESNAGFNRFSKFVQEAGARGLIKVTKQDTGQFEVAPAPAGAIPSGAAKPGREASVGGTTKPGREGSPAPKESEGRPSRGRRGRGGRGVPQAEAPAAPAPAPAPTTAPEATEGEADKDRRRRRRGGRGRGRGGEEKEPSTAEAPARSAEHALTLAEAFHLMTRALGEMPAPVPHESLRGRMAALHGREDPLLEPAAFVRLLRQANDAEVADVRMLGEGQFEVSPHKTDLALQLRPAAEPATNGAPATTVARPASALRFRSGSLAAKRTSTVPMVGVIKLEGPATPPSEAPVEAATPEPAVKKPSRRGGKKATTKATAAPAKDAKAPKKRSRAKSARKSPPKSDAT
jgi:uncharacterized protein (TIGR00288 family)